MALPSTLHRFDLALSNVDRGVERTLTLSAARHPSETMERLWLRVLALCWRFEDGLAFGPGLCEPDAPDLAAPAPGGGLAALVRVGKPDPERVDRDLTRNPGARVAVLFEGPRRMEAFLAEARERGLDRLARAELAAADPALLSALAGRDGRRIRVGATVVADHVYLEIDSEPVDGPLHRGGL
jgi:uncharacterized protein YaeQ